MQKVATAILLTSILTACQKTSEPPKADVGSVAASTSEIKKQSTPIAKTYDGPFGLAMGIPDKELSTNLGFTPATTMPYIFIGKPPKPVTGFAEFFAIALPSTGLCKTGAKSVLTNVNGSGDQIKEEADKIAGMLELKYGKPTSKFTYAKDTYKRNPEYWMLGLKEESVAYDYFWESKKANPALPNNIVQISLISRAQSISEGTVTLGYEFSNYEECTKEIKKMKAENL